MASASLAIVVLAVLWAATAPAADASSGRYPLWDRDTPFPVRASLRYPAGATDVMVHRAGADRYSFLHDAAIAAHNGTLFAA